MNRPSIEKSVDLRKMFAALQEALVAKVSLGSAGSTHPVGIGDANEEGWREMLASYLPRRYRIAKGFVVDSTEQVSDEIDVIVFDRQYSPLLLTSGGREYVPAESVYAVFEVKSTFAREKVQDAGTKAASVRRLHRTSVQIHHAGGVLPPKPPVHILAGLLANRYAPRAPFDEVLTRSLGQLEEAQRLDLGCCLGAGGFCLPHPLDENGTSGLCVSQSETALMSFLLWLLRQLQFSATVAAIDFDQYRRLLE